MLDSSEGKEDRFQKTRFPIRTQNKVTYIDLEGDECNGCDVEDDKKNYNHRESDEGEKDDVEIDNASGKEGSGKKVTDRSRQGEKRHRSLASLAERLRVKPRPSYFEGDDKDQMDEEELAKAEVKTKEAKQEPDEESDESDDDEEVCEICQEGGSVLCCDACPRVYHKRCLDPPLKSTPKGDWICPKCQSPLEELDRILDFRVGEPREEEASTSSKSRKEFLVKWKKKSYIHCSWIKQEEMEKAAQKLLGVRSKLNNFLKQQGGTKRLSDQGEPEEAIRTEWITVDRIIDMRRNRQGNAEYLVKWKELGYDECSWEDAHDIEAFQAEIERYRSLAKSEPIRLNPSPGPGKRRKGSGDGAGSRRRRRDYDETPSFLKGGELYPYQLEGLNWLRFAWQQNKHVILADEMGLGKTVQSIAFFAALHEVGGSSPPHLVVAPLSTLRNWEREFATWAPHLNVVMYVGSGAARAVIRQHEFYFPVKAPPLHSRKRKAKVDAGAQKSKQERIKFHVLLTSYEMVNLDMSFLKAIQWESLVVDEGHRLKNKASKLFQSLHSFHTNHRILLTGTPLQNNLDELFMLMHFLDASKFESLEEFQEQFRDLNQEEQVGKLHKMLAPHLLRRMKKDVLKTMPPKKELIVRVELSTLQKTFYKAVLTRNFQALSRHGSVQINLNNVMMELRKVCGHPYLIDGAEPPSDDPEDQHRKLTEASGKLALLEKMLAKLKDTGHRVLIYSQFTRILDIIEDWIEFKGWGFERIDGSINGAERQIRIDRFNSPTSTRFCFLLSTRAGGLGINLATADTVVIYDSDWNPHADLQAMARAHRLGQKGTVMIYRLVTRGTIEERMMQMTKKKMVLEHLVVGKMKTSALNQEELDDILRYGSKELFEKENEGEDGQNRHIHYDDAAIDRLLDRSLVTAEEVTTGGEEENEYLTAFKVANFEYVDEDLAREEEEDREAAAMDAKQRAQYWEGLLRDKFEGEQVLSAEALGKGKRVRKQVDYAEGAGAHEMEEPSSGDNASLASSQPPVGSDDSTKSEQASPRAARTPAPAVSIPAERTPLMKGEGRQMEILGFNDKQRKAFTSVFMKYGLGDPTWKQYVTRLKPKTVEQVKEYGALFLSHITEPASSRPCYSDGVPKEGPSSSEVLSRLALLQLMRNKVEAAQLSPLQAPFAPDSRLAYSKHWSPANDIQLLQGVLRHGYGKWQDVVTDSALGLSAILRKELNLLSYAPPAAPSPSTALPQPLLTPPVTAGLLPGVKLPETLQTGEMKVVPGGQAEAAIKSPQNSLCQQAAPVLAEAANGAEPDRTGSAGQVAAARKGELDVVVISRPGPGPDPSPGGGPAAAHLHPDLELAWKGLQEATREDLPKSADVMLMEAANQRRMSEWVKKRLLQLSKVLLNEHTHAQVLLLERSPFATLSPSAASPPAPSTQQTLSAKPFHEGAATGMGPFALLSAANGEAHIPPPLFGPSAAHPPGGGSGTRGPSPPLSPPAMMQPLAATVLPAGMSPRAATPSMVNFPIVRLAAPAPRPMSELLRLAVGATQPVRADQVAPHPWGPPEEPAAQKPSKAPPPSLAQLSTKSNLAGIGAAGPSPAPRSFASNGTPPSGAPPAVPSTGPGAAALAQPDVEALERKIGDRQPTGQASESQKKWPASQVASDVIIIDD